MGAAYGLAASLAVGALFAVILVYAPFVGVRRDARLSTVVAILAAGVALLTLTFLIVSLVAHRAEASPWTMNSYFLAGAHRLAGAYYDFWWTRRWIYPVGSFTPLVAIGAIVALAAGYSAISTARRVGAAIVVLASLMLVAYVLVGGITAWATWRFILG